MLGNEPLVNGGGGDGGGCGGSGGGGGCGGGSWSTRCYPIKSNV